MMLKVYLLLTI